MKVFLAFLIVCISTNHVFSQVNTTGFPVVWYNVENLFDCEDDSLTVDEQFTPNGDKHWTHYRYWKKIKNLSKALLSVTEWNYPGLIGLCEVENEQVLKDLVYKSPLSGLKLNYIHQNSPDRRGIDVALLYNPKLFSPLSIQFVPVIDPNDTTWKTREILYCKGIIHPSDTLHCFVNHWPSKYGGAVKSEPKRILAAKVLKKHCDSILSTNKNASILAMGDFNETSTETAIAHLLNSDLEILKVKGLQKGTHKYKGNWSQIDYFFVSQNLLESDENCLTVTQWEVGEAPFLLEPDANYSGVKPSRSYIGFKYNGGYSDHLPLVLYLGKK